MPSIVKEATAGAVDRARVSAVDRDVAVLVEQVGAGDAYVVEAQTAVVDAVQSALEPVVLSSDARQVDAVIAAQRHVEAVHPVVDAVRDQLGEHRRRDAVQCGVAEVLLRRAAERRVDDELLRRGVVRRGRADRGDI
ncbi:hypothetical protein QE375_003479 [Microbacterium foliorum]|uniref:Uncharacterized protein n=1 Tax=Microbacterium foliorum TaxID=104336 RepID=A0ABU1HXS9_9MICO|nr:hypothetical protein [Microbacterium foliorum]